MALASSSSSSTSIVATTAILLFIAAQTWAQPIAPTYWGVNPCDYAPEFYLQDVNPRSSSFSTIPYGLYYQNVTDLIIVGLYLADTELSQQNAQRQQDLGAELQDMGFTVRNVALNYYAPMGCALDGYCVNPWTMMFSGWDTCMGYTAGCPPGDSRLSFEKWQKPMVMYNQENDDYLTMSVFQDTDWTMAWDLFGGLEGDLFIYDGAGRLYSYMCNQDNIEINPEAWGDCPDGLIGGGLRNQTSYDAALAMAVEAGQVEDLEGRCEEYSYTADWYSALADWNKRAESLYYVDDWYYYSDFGWNADKTKGNVISIERRHTKHKFQHKIPTYVWATFLALLATAGTGFVMYRRWKAVKALDAERGTVRFTQLATEDDDLVLEGTLVEGGLALDMRKDDTYGSI